MARSHSPFPTSLLTFALVSTLGACIPTIKSVFVDMSYPSDPPKSADRNVALSVDTAVAPALLVGYEHPQEIGACLAEMATSSTNLDGMWSFGDCMAGGGNRSSCMSKLPWVTAAPSGTTPPFSLKFKCAKAPSTDRDRLALALSLDDASVAIVSYELAALGPSAIHDPLPAPVRAAFGRTLLHAAMVLQADPVPTHDTRLPALSLSGGAANGAFVAGFLYALLSIREQARFYGNWAQRALIDRERFGAAFGSSVGSLISLPVDLYFTDAAPSTALRPALDACIKLGSGKVAARDDRSIQDCGLALLEHDFVANEWELLCARHGSALELLKPDAKSLLRFDPLQQGHIDPFLKSFGVLTRDNSFVRTVMVADLGQGVLEGLDERACRLAGMDADKCEREAILTSVSEPVLAPSRDRIYSGLDGPGGEAGIWLDGGLQSVNPAARAVAYTNGKVLAVNTFRALGTPVAGIQGLTPIVLGTLTTIGTRMIGWETSYAGLEQHRRRSHACEVGKLTGCGPPCPEGMPIVGPAAASPALMAVSVPDDIAPQALFASGYTFDPVVMRGLFLWGERTLLRSRAEVLQFLDWCAPLALESGSATCSGGEGTSPAYVAALQKWEQRVSAEIADYKKYEVAGAWKGHLAERKALVDKNLTTCSGD
jgi:hypothetical protein